MLIHLLRAGMLVLLALLLANCGPQAPAPEPAPGDEIRFQGTVVDTIDDCAFDGICALVVETDTARHTVVWAEGMRQCAGDYAGGVAVGDQVEVLAAVQDAGSVSICGADSYFIQPLAESGATR